MRSVVAVEREPRTRLPGMVRLPQGQAVPWESLLASIGVGRVEADEWERLAVAVARRQGASWDRLSVVLGGRPSGEQLRRRHGGGS